tara:strand:- start:308 stop:508 length:201 start_codon:yes stop_codon:yes gene_type:complete
MTDKNLVETIDLVDEMEWEDCDKIEKVSLEEAGLEEETCEMDEAFTHSIYAYLNWFYDGEMSEFDK